MRRKETCLESAKILKKLDKKAAGKNSLDYIYVGHSSESCYVRGLGHQEEMRAGMKGQCDTSHMAYHIKETHGGRESEAKFVMKKVKSYPSTFLRILAECIRIKYRSREKGISVLNRSYTLPRLSVGGQDQEGEPQAPAQGNVPGDDRSQSRKWASSARKGKVKFKQKI